MKKQLKRFCCLFLCVALIVTMNPVVAFAHDENETLIESESQVFLNTAAINSADLSEFICRESDYTYSTSGTQATITRYNGSDADIRVPDTLGGLPVKVIGRSAFYGCYGLQRVVLPEGVETIEPLAFAGCSELKEIVFPSTLRSIGNVAFDSCSKLTRADLPDGLTTLGEHVFNYCSSLTYFHYPRSLTSIGGGCFQGCTALKKITVPEGITALPRNAFASAAALQTVELPDSLRSIGRYAFTGCYGLRYLHIPASVETIDDRAFLERSSGLTLYVPKSSNALIYAIQKNIPFVAESGRDDWDGNIFNRQGCMYYADLNSLSTNGCIGCTIQYELKDIYEGVDDKKLVVFIPSGMQLLEATLTLDGRMLHEYTYQSNELIVPVNAGKADLRFSLRVSGPLDALTSYAYLSFRQGEENHRQCIDVLSENIDALTLDMADIISEEKFTVSGIAPAASLVTLLINDVQAAQVTASRTGEYSAEILLDSPVSDTRYLLKAQTISTDGELLTASRSFLYRELTPEVTEFLLYYNEKTSLDLLSPSANMQKVYFNPMLPMVFTLKIKNNEEVEHVFITSTRNNTKYSMEAFYDESLGSYIARGYFDETFHSYVPGQIGVEFVLKHKKVAVSPTVDINEYISIDTGTGSVESNENTVTATFDLGNINNELANVILTATLETIDLNDGTELADILGSDGVVGTGMSYIVPGINDEKYIAQLDFSDPETIFMIIADTSEATDVVYKLHLNYADLNGDYGSIIDLGETISKAGDIFNVLYETVGIEKDHNALVQEINQSTTIVDKDKALQQADELHFDRIAFVLLTVMMKSLIEGAAVGAIGAATIGPAIVFTGLIAVITALSGGFWDYRIADITGNKVKPKWCVDPSGYVYEAVTTNRLEGVEAAAFWVAFDEENESFWDEVPEENAGVLWDASEWNQVNPLITDAEGRYQWDVPEGWWQVRFSKDGYDGISSEWLCVAPPQTEINIPMVSHEAPVWDSVTVDESSIMLHSSKYLKLDTVSSIQLLDADDKEINYSLTWPEDEADADGTVYADRFTFTTDTKMLPGDHLVIQVPMNSIMSYSGAYMPAARKEVSYVGPKQIRMDDEILIQQGTQTEFTVSVENFDPSDRLTATVSMPSTASVIDIGPLNQNGQTRIVVESNLPGTADLTVEIKDTGIKKTVPITVFSQSAEQNHDHYTVDLLQTARNVYGCTVESDNTESGSVMIAAAAYSGNKMTHFTISGEEQIMDNRVQLMFNWDNIDENTIIHIMIWDWNSLKPRTVPFVF